MSIASAAAKRLKLPSTHGPYDPNDHIKGKVGVGPMNRGTGNELDPEVRRKGYNPPAPKRT